MLRIPNPGADLDVFVRIFRDLHSDLKGHYGFDMDEIVKAMVKRSNVSSQGAFGEEALRRSTKKDRSRDQLYNQAKMYTELYRTLGWIHSTEKKLLFAFSRLGEYVAIADDPRPLVVECLLGIAYPNEVLDVKGTQTIRPFPLILRCMHALDGFISRDEIIVGPMSVSDDRDESEMSMLFSRLREYRRRPEILTKELIILSKKRKISKTTMGNYTRFPIAAIQWAGWAEKRAGCFHLAAGGREQVENLATLVDFRVSDFYGMPNDAREAFVRATFYRMIERARFNLAPVLAKLREDEEMLSRRIKIDASAALFSPFQQVGHKFVESVMPLRDPGSMSIKAPSAARIESPIFPVTRKSATPIIYKFQPAKTLRPHAGNAALREIASTFAGCSRQMDHALDAMMATHASSNQNIFYPLVVGVFQCLGFDCRLSRKGTNYQRADAIIVDNGGSMPIEIKSPGEEVEISVKAVRQALENKIVLMARKHYPGAPEDTSLVVGYKPPNDRSEVHELVEDIYCAFGVRIGIIDFRSLLFFAFRAHAVGKAINLENLKQLKGLIDVEYSPAK